MMAKAIAYHVKMVLLVSQGPDIVKHVQLVNNKPILRAVTAYLVNSVQILVSIKMKIFNVKHAQRDLVNQIKVNHSVFPALVVHLVLMVKVNALPKKIKKYLKKKTKKLTTWYPCSF